MNNDKGEAGKNKKCETIQIQLNAIRFKRAAISQGEIERLKFFLQKQGVRILKITIKPTTSTNCNGGTG